MIRFSANLGFLWTDRALPDAILAAGTAGFDAVECHMPYDVAATAVRAALDETGLAMVSLNTRVGDRDRGEFGLAALPGREGEARAYIDEALAYASAIGCAKVSVIAGNTMKAAEAEATFRSNLAYAAARGAEQGTTILIEPINTRFMPDYHLTHVADALSTIEAVGAANLKIMIDCFHTQVMEGDLTERFRSAMPHVGHIQISAVPDRGEPDAGEIDYRWLLPRLVELGYEGHFGAEYTPRTTVEDGLGWMNHYRANAQDSGVEK